MKETRRQVIVSLDTRAHLAGRDDELVAVKPMLDRPGAAGMAERLRPSAADDAAFAAVRGAERAGRPLGNADFIAGPQRLLGRPIAHRAPGRKPAEPAIDQPNLLECGGMRMGNMYHVPVFCILLIVSSGRVTVVESGELRV